MAGADSHPVESREGNEDRNATQVARSHSSQTFAELVYADGSKHPITKPKSDGKPHQNDAGKRANAARGQYRSILEDAAAEAYAPIQNLDKLEHLYDKRIATNRDAVAYAAQALKFTGDPYNTLILNESNFPDQDAGVGIHLTMPTDDNAGHGAKNQPVGQNDLQPIASVDPNSEAAKAKLAAGDQITAVDGISMRGYAPDDIDRVLGGVVGTKVDVTVVHDGQERTVHMQRRTSAPVTVAPPDDKTGKIGMEYGMLAPDHKHLEPVTKDAHVNSDVASTQPQTDDIIVAAIMNNSAAEKAGLHRGDVVRQVNGHNIAGETFEKVAEELRGKVGEPIDLTVLRDGKQQTLHVVRGQLTYPNVAAKDMGDGIEYIKINNFEDGTLAGQLQKIMQENAKAKGFILDLRGNPGGLVDQAVSTAELFVKDGPLYSTRDRVTGDPKNPKFETTKVGVTSTNVVNEFLPDGGGSNTSSRLRDQPYLLNGRPMLVLTNGQSASASEIVTGALHDNKIATTLGEKTYGKGIGQTLQDGDLPSYKLKMTTFRYFTPSGFWPGDAHKNRIGMDPDITVPDDLTAGDPQLTAGMEWMKKHL
jgi:C-terminal processing protease CtpA/Prc